MKNNSYIIVAICCLTTIAILIGSVVINRYAHQVVVEEEETPPCESQLTVWQLLQMAIIMTESNFNYQAVGKSGDYGIMQITKVYVDEVNRILDTAYFTHEDAFNIKSSLDMFSVYQEYYNPEHDVTKAISLHNPKGSVLSYEERVMRNFLLLSRMEEVRNVLIKNQ